MSKGTTLRNVRISDDLWARAGKAAKSTDTNVSEVIRQALESYIQEIEDKQDRRAWLAGFGPGHM